jgi:hypothetical protein
MGIYYYLKATKSRTMNKFYTAFSTLLLVLFSMISLRATAQCGAGYTQTTLNWDYLDYFPFTGTYGDGSYLNSASLSTTQNFAFGKNRLTIATAGSVMSIIGETGNHTADAGDDLEYSATDGTITLTFDQEVQNLRFSVYDIDRRQTVAVNGKNAANVDVVSIITKRVPLNINMTLAPVTGIGLNPQASYVNSSVANSSNDGTIDVVIAGPVRTVTLTVGNTGSVSSPELFVSDIVACVAAGTFATDYYNVSRPFTGQASYILHSFDRSVYMLDPATGVTKLLFTDGTTPLGAITASNRCYINSMAYDPYNRVLYYVYSLTASPGGNRMLRKYDFNTGAISTVLSDISSAVYGTGVDIPVVSNTSGIASRGTGVESGAAAFYDGALYLGIETPNRNGSGLLNTSNREVVIWRIDFDGSNMPYRASQTFAMPVDNGSGSLRHDWSDFAITNGVLYDFDGAGVTTQTDVFQYNMVTGATTNFAVPAGWTPGQPAVDWNNNIYQLYATTVAPAVNPYVALYNSTTGTIGTQIAITSAPMYTPAIPSLGDAGEAFRPFCDFGDAPASYDPNPLSPAVHEISNGTLQLGTSVDDEFLTRGQTALANSDNFDDGVAFVPIFSNLYSTYHVTVSVLNNSGTAANLRGWLDYNGNGVFDAGEASTAVSVPSSATLQNINLPWTGISSTLPTGAFTYLRIRLTSAAMTGASATGYFVDGETEDYRVSVQNIVLPITLLSFDAKAVNDSKVKIDWSASEDVSLSGYEVQRSHNGTDWLNIGFVAASPSGNGVHKYELIDNSPYRGTSRYRLKIIEANNQSRYSEIKTVKLSDLSALLTLAPNPTVSKATLTIVGDMAGEIAQVRIMNTKGNELSYQKIRLSVGNNPIDLPLQSSWPAGTYLVMVSTDAGTVSKKLVISK